MAFGFGFNKQKALSAAEKYVQQGKLQNAISEYEKILKNDAKELTVYNTVGDLYARLGEADKATDAFKAVGDAYATQGFTVKAIAMFKKISKLKPSLENVLKLAELYTQQGLFNDARAQYLQVAEQFLKANEYENAVRIFQKILEMDPENVSMRVRLAEVYVRMGKKDEAWQIFSAAAESMRSRGSLTGAEEVLQRMLAIDPTNSYALLMQAKNLIDSGDGEAAIACLQKIADLDSNPEALRDLLKACLQLGRLSEASTLANKLLTVHNDLTSISTFADALMQAGQYENALQVYDQHADRLLAENSGKVLEQLHAIIGHVRDNPASLEKLLALFQKAGETTHITEVCELLAHASVQCGDLPRARDLYQKLAQLEPQNPLHMKSYQQVVSQLGGAPVSAKLITAEEAAVIVDELEATAPPVHQHYADDVAIAVRSALTDAELFISYNMPAKAFEPLLAACAQAPNDLRLNQRLAALHTRASRFSEAAVCCRTLKSIYSDAGYPEDATRYGELADRYEERSSVATIHEDSPAVHDFAVEASAETDTQEETASRSAEPWPSLSPKMTAGDDVAEFSVVDETPAASETSLEAPAEIDLSDWEDSITVESDAPVEVAETDVADSVGDHELPGAAAIEIIDEMRFYLSHGMPEQARAVLPKLQALTQDDRLIAQLRQEVEAAVKAVAAKSQEAKGDEKKNEKKKEKKEVAKTPEPVEITAAPEFEVAEIPVEAALAEEISVEDIPAAQITSAIDEPTPVVELSATVEQPAQAETLHTESVSASALPAEVAQELPVVDLPVTAEATIPSPHVALVDSAPATPLKELVADLESSLGEFAPAPAPFHVHATSPITVDAPAAIPAQIAATMPVAVPAESIPEPVVEAKTIDTVVALPAPALGEFVADLEASLGDDFLKSAPKAPESVPVAAAPVVAAPVIATVAAAPAQTADFTPASPISAPLAANAAAASASAAHGASLPQTPAAAVTAPTPQMAAAAPPVAAASPVLPSGAKTGMSPFAEETGIDLNVMFGELKQDLEADISSADEDPETHYNLGVAFREMGLLDEAIGELQKTCQSIERGRPFPQTMQAYTWLAQCFLDKGVPEAAARWYDKALGVAGIDGETRTALHYELGSAFETAGDKPAALKHFMNVYGSNIDYRDVAERIKALKS
ncbi:MAG: tetratricopeptide repeat protein [Candidatus Sulfotelmatobacter sp.]